MKKEPGLDRARVVACRPSADYHLWVQFADGLTGAVYLGNLIHIGAFKAWRNVGFFMTAKPNSAGAVVWDGVPPFAPGVRLDPLILYMDVEENGGKRSASAAPSPRARPAPDAAYYRFMARVLEPVAGLKKKGRGT